jgi:hypothetical protein
MDCADKGRVMKKQVFLRWFWCLLEYLMVCPIILIIAGFSLPQDSVVPFTLVLPLHTLVAVAITSVLKRFRNILVAGIGIAYTAGFVWLWIALFQVESIGGVVLVASGTAFLFAYGIRVAIDGSVREYFYYTLGLFVHMVAVFLMNQAPALMPFQKSAVAFAILYVITGIPLANRRFLIRETQQKSSLHIIPGTVLRGNKIILSIFLAGIILLSFWDTLLNGIVYVVDKIVEGIRKFLMWLASFNKPPEGVPEGGGGQMQLPPAENNPTMSLILDILSLLLVAAIAFFIIRYLVKNYKRIYAALYSYLSAFFSRFHKWSATEQGYFDKQESLLKTDIPRRGSFLQRIFKREPRWKDMKDNTSRVRFLYTRFVLGWIRKGYVFNVSETPDETIKRIEQMEKDGEKDHGSLRNTYRQARYGNKEIDDNTVKTLKDIYL